MSCLMFYMLKRFYWDCSLKRLKGASDSFDRREMLGQAGIVDLTCYLFSQFRKFSQNWGLLQNVLKKKFVLLKPVKTGNFTLTFLPSL